MDNNQEILEKILAVTEENNRMLTKIYRSQQFAKYSKLIYWAVIVIMSIAAFYFAQSYIDSIVGAMGDTNGSSLLQDLVN